jgi:ABC-type sugar transport system ATPase subunit
MSNNESEVGASTLAVDAHGPDFESVTGNPEVALAVVDLAKAYGSTQALRSCSLTLRTGQVHAVVGENGSGKSTMVKLVTGVAQSDRGTIDVGGVIRPSFRSPREAMAEGIVGVFQNMMVVPARSVLDNVWLGYDGIFARKTTAEERRDRGGEILGELLGRVPNLDAEASTLALSELQAVGIARALLRKPTVLILDEATSALDIGTRERLFEILKRFATAGTASLFISHRMDEIEQIGDVITIMRAGQTVATVNRGDVSTAEIVTMMAGAEREAAERSRARHEASAHGSRPVLSTRDVVLEPGSPPINQAILTGRSVFCGCWQALGLAPE